MSEPTKWTHKQAGVPLTEAELAERQEQRYLQGNARPEETYQQRNMRMGWGCICHGETSCPDLAKATHVVTRTERFQCTPDHPWRPGLPTPVTHPDACDVREQQEGWPAGDIMTYACPHCGHRWTVELSQ